MTAHSRAGKQRTLFESPFMVVLWAFTFVVVEGIAVQAGGQVASWVFGGHRVVFGPIGSGAGIFGRLVHHLGDPKAAWNLPARAALPGPAALWASLLLTHLVVLGLVVVVISVRSDTLVERSEGPPARLSRPVEPRSSGAWAAGQSSAIPSPSTGRTRLPSVNRSHSGSTSPPALDSSPNPRTTSSPSACLGSARARGS